jgi:two-component system, OmpR family, response regulator
MKNKAKILLVEDDPNLGLLLKEFLEVKELDVTLAIDGEMGLLQFQKMEFDILLLDIMMPKKDGFTLAKEVREIDDKIPIIFLSAKSLQGDKIEGFKLGADDYITKPFSMEELLYRISAILKRVDKVKECKDKAVIIGMYLYDNSKRTLRINNSIKKLTTKENQLLNLLIDKNGEVLLRNEALVKIWKSDSYFNSRSMDVYISKLRNYLNKDNSIEIINIHGEGFKIIY